MVSCLLLVVVVVSDLLCVVCGLVFVVCFRFYWLSVVHCLLFDYSFFVVRCFCMLCVDLRTLCRLLVVVCHVLFVVRCSCGLQCMFACSLLSGEYMFCVLFYACFLCACELLFVGLLVVVCCLMLVGCRV